MLYRKRLEPTGRSAIGPGKGPVETKPENERDRLRELAARIATEQDHDKFTELVKEMNQLLDEKLQRARNSAHTTDA